MYLASFLNNLIKEDGFVLINANSTKYIIGRPKKENPIHLRILDVMVMINYYMVVCFSGCYFV